MVVTDQIGTLCQEIQDTILAIEADLLDHIPCCLSSLCSHMLHVPGDNPFFDLGVSQCPQIDRFIPLLCAVFQKSLPLASFLCACHVLHYFARANPVKFKTLSDMNFCLTF
jgi:hypothetical protein